ncbi:uncharacterized protein V6R79_022965 [Siganus canaliculatus]
MTPQDDTESLPAGAMSSTAQTYSLDISTNLSAVDMSSAEGEDLLSPLADIAALGTVKVVRASEWVVRQASADSRRSHPIRMLEVLYMFTKLTPSYELSTNSDFDSYYGETGVSER